MSDSVIVILLVILYCLGALCQAFCEDDEKTEEDNEAQWETISSPDSENSHQDNSIEMSSAIGFKNQSNLSTSLENISRYSASPPKHVYPIEPCTSIPAPTLPYPSGSNTSMPCPSLPYPTDNSPMPMPSSTIYPSSFVTPYPPVSYPFASNISTEISYSPISSPSPFTNNPPVSLEISSTAPYPPICSPYPSNLNTTATYQGSAPYPTAPGFKVPSSPQDRKSENLPQNVNDAPPSFDQAMHTLSKKTEKQIKES